MKKIINLTHSDLDGVVCAILLKKIYSEVKVHSCTYKTVNDKFGELINEFPNATYYITDMSLDESKFKEFLVGNKNIHLIDHHPAAESSIIENKVVYMNRGSGCKLVLDTLLAQGHLFDSEMKKLVEIASDYDTWTHKLKMSKILNRLYSYYRFKGFLNRFEDGISNFTEEEKEYIKKNNDHINSYLKSIEVFDIDDGCYLVKTKENYVDEICQYIIDTLNADTVFLYHVHSKKLMLRGKYLNYGEFAKEFGGGGHPYAASISIGSGEELGNIIQKFLERRK